MQNIIFSGLMNRILVGCVGLLFFLSGLANASAVDRGVKFTKEDRSDLKYMIQLAKKQNKRSGPLDFSDPQQYRFYLRHAIRSGATPETSPQFFKELEITKKRHIKYGGIPKDRTRLTSADSTAINIISGFGAASDKEKNFSVSALSSTPRGSEQTRLTLQLLDSNYNALGPLGQKSEYAKGENTQVQTTGQFSSATTPSASRIVYISGTYNYQPYGGAAKHGYMVQQSDTVPSAITTAKPAKNGGTVQGQIRVCLNRSGPDCDISESSGGQQNVIFPVEGSITYFDEVQTPFTDNNSFSSIIITKEQSGGGCLMADESSFFNNSTLSADKKTLSWNIKPAQFGPACFNQADTVIYSFTAQVTVGTGADARPVFAYVTNASDAVADLNTAKILPMQFRWGCVAADSMIRVIKKNRIVEMAIQDVAIGDYVVANRFGDLVRVDANTIGTEPLPMIRIKTDNGASVLVTNGHPMVTSRGVLLARHLRTGDVMYGDNKEHVTITKLSKEKYKGNVWSLDVSPITKKGKHLGVNGTTFYANGILVGDVKMQNQHERLARLDTRTVLERLPKKWHADYFNHIKKTSN